MNGPRSSFPVLVFRFNVRVAVDGGEPIVFVISIIGICESKEKDVGDDVYVYMYFVCFVSNVSNVTFSDSLANARQMGEERGRQRGER